MILHSDRKDNDCIWKLRCHCIQILHSDIYSGGADYANLNITVEDLLLFNRNKIFGQTQSDSTKKTIPSYNLIIFYVFKMAMAIAFLCENTVDTI